MTPAEHANYAASILVTELRAINDNLTETLARRGSQLLAAIAERNAAIEENTRLRAALDAKEHAAPELSTSV
jgi:histidinol dehydrogenase